MKKRTKMMCIVILIIFLVAIYNIMNNSRIDIVTQDIVIENLPDEFNGFTILQVTDLHSKEFGENQEILINLINSLEYDILAITGDMQNIQKNDYEPFLKLIEGINNKDEIYYTPGNHGPYIYEGNFEFIDLVRNRVYEKPNENREFTEIGERLLDIGIKYLDKVYSVRRGDKTLWISELLYSDEFDSFTNNESRDNDIKIALTHYPISKEIYEGKYGDYFEKYDLVLAANNHGGQWRIPLYGAIYIPDRYGSKWFPVQERVSGLVEWGGFKQYVSRGLWASSKYDILRFRLFNRPEINLIRLVKR